MSWELKFIEVYQEATDSDQDVFHAVDLADLTSQDPKTIGRDIYRLKEKYGEDLPVKIERDSPVDASKYYFNEDMRLEELRDLLETDETNNKKERLLNEVMAELDPGAYTETELNSLVSSIAQNYYNRRIHRAKASGEIKDKLEKEGVLDKNGNRFHVEAE